MCIPRVLASSFFLYFFARKKSANITHARIVHTTSLVARRVYARKKNTTRYPSTSFIYIQRSVGCRPACCCLSSSSLSSSSFTSRVAYYKVSPPRVAHMANGHLINTAPPRSFVIIRATTLLCASDTLTPRRHTHTHTWHTP